MDAGVDANGDGVLTEQELAPLTDALTLGADRSETDRRNWYRASRRLTFP